MRKKHLRALSKILLSFLFASIVSLNSDAVFASSADFSGTWDSNWGEMVFEQTGGNVTGTYATSNGKIFGTIQGNVLEGYWTQSTAGQRCTTEKQGRYHWGRIRFVLDKSGNFTGSWGYCENTPSSGGWSGTRREGSVLGKANENAHSFIAGEWKSNWGNMAFEQTGNEVTGTYATSNGKIFGTLRENMLEGYWTQSSAGRKCATQKYGSYYWGRIKFAFDNQNNSFSGDWGYCESTPSSGGWSGTRK